MTEAAVSSALKAEADADVSPVVLHPLILINTLY